MSKRVRILVAVTSLLVLTASPATARAQSFGDPVEELDASESRLEERYADGTFDAGDLAAFAHLGRRTEGAGSGSARSWLSLVGFAGELPNGRQEAGVLAVVSFAFDRAASRRASLFAGARTPFVADGPAPSTPPPGVAPAADSPVLLSPALARGAVSAAWRQSGLEASDARIDAIVARARLSALLPETRLRAMRTFDERERTDLASAQTTYYDATGAKLWLEARLTWRFDRLLYADDEPTLERVRLERQEARARIASRVLELLFQWQRARLDLQASQAGSRAELDATLRALESEAALDIVTGGWFSSRGR